MPERGRELMNYMCAECGADLRSSDHRDGCTSDPDFDSDDSEALSVYDAADIWMSSGMDEDRMFGYSEDELRRAAGAE
jgi:hypothetical protein